MSATRAPTLAQGARIALVPSVGADADGGVHVGATGGAGDRPCWGCWRRPEALPAKRACPAGKGALGRVSPRAS